VRPNGVGKAFSGSVVGTERYPVRSFLAYIDAYSEERYANETFHVRRPVDILGEYRFVCGSGGYVDYGQPGIITASQYRYQRVHDERIDVHPAAERLALKFLSEHKGPDVVFVMDIAVLEDETAKIIEFNNFSNCGLYACSRHKVVERVSQVIAEMYPIQWSTV
jgi:hypothetical protein